MVVLDKDLVARFLACLVQHRIVEKDHAFYVKWLRYYVDFCHKYGLMQEEAASLQPFLKKLRQKKQSDWQVQQAAAAIGFFHRLCLQASKNSAELSSVIAQAELLPSRYAPVAESSPMAHTVLASVEQKPEGEGAKTLGEGVVQVDEPGKKYGGNGGSYNQRYQVTVSALAGSEPSTTMPVMARGGSTRVQLSSSPAAEKTNTIGASWVSEYTRLSDEVKVRHLSPKTYRTYCHYVRKFQAFTKSLDPAQLNTEHVKAFLTSLAVRHQVAASTQNLAFNSLLFFFPACARPRVRQG